MFSGGHRRLLGGLEMNWKPWKDALAFRAERHVCSATKYKYAVAITDSELTVYMYWPKWKFWVPYFLRKDIEAEAKSLKTPVYVTIQHERVVKGWSL